MAFPTIHLYESSHPDLLTKYLFDGGSLLENAYLFFLENYVFEDEIELPCDEKIKVPGKLISVR